MAAKWQQLVNAGAYFSFNLWWQLDAVPTFYSFVSGSAPGSPSLTAKNANGDTLLSLGPIPDVNGSWIQINTAPFVNSAGVTIPAFESLYCYLSQVTTALYAGMALYFQVDFIPPNMPAGTGDVRIIDPSSQLIFTRDLHQVCGTGATSVDPESVLANELLDLGYSGPIEDDWRGSVAPPPTPVLNRLYIVPHGATGAWAGHDGEIAFWGAGGWVFELYPEGCTAFIRNRYQRAELVDFTYAAPPTVGAPALNTDLLPSDVNTMAWAESPQLFFLTNKSYLGAVQGESDVTLPTNPAPWEKWVLGGSPVFASWPDHYQIAAPPMIATAVIDQATNAVRWLYQTPGEGSLIYRLDMHAFYYFAAGTWQPLIGSGAAFNTVLHGVGVPDAGVGNLGDFYIDTSVDVIYGPKTGGGWGAGTSMVGTVGATGPQGPPGAGLNSLLHGIIAPGAGVGSNGDFYIDDVAWMIYGPKAGGAWPAGVSIIGPTGATGATGAAGAAGATGATGPAGPGFSTAFVEWTSGAVTNINVGFTAGNPPKVPAGVSYAEVSINASVAVQDPTTPTASMTVTQYSSVGTAKKVWAVGSASLTSGAAGETLQAFIPFKALAAVATGDHFVPTFSPAGYPVIAPSWVAQMQKIG